MAEKSYKSGFATLIGRPNVGKSTLMNHLIGQKIAITSNKPQTTRNRIQTVYTDEKGQIVFLDTPGIHKAKNKLGEYMVNVAENTLKEVDVILWLVEPTTFIGAGERHIAEQLSKIKTPVILVINKIDTIPKKDMMMEKIAAFSELFPFEAVVPVSALNGDGLPQLLDQLSHHTKEGPHYFPDDAMTDQPERVIIAEIIREKLLNCLNEEIPHGTAVTIEQMTEREHQNLIDIHAVIYCEKDSHKRIIIGKQEIGRAHV